MREEQVHKAIERLHRLYQHGQLSQELFETKKRELLAQLDHPPHALGSHIPSRAPEGSTPGGSTPGGSAPGGSTPSTSPMGKLITRDFHNTQRIPAEKISQLLVDNPDSKSSNSDELGLFVPTPDNLEEIRQLREGDLVRGRYRLKRLLGMGGMGQVFLAHDLRFHGDYALKVLHPWVVRHDPTIIRFVQEFKIMEHLNHNGIVRTYLLDEDTGHDSLFYLMEYVDGETLQQVLDRNIAERGVPPFNGEETLEFLEKLADILRYTHSKHILHRDLKPTNIMLVEEDGETALKLLDFGLAKHLTGSSEQALHTGQAGTFFYIAPEQLMGGETATVAADIFSIGVILYQMLTGSLPVAMATPPSELNPSLPKRLDHVLRRAMDVHWQRRPQSIDEFLDAFASAFPARKSASSQRPPKQRSSSENVPPKPSLHPSRFTDESINSAQQLRPLGSMASHATPPRPVPVKLEQNLASVHPSVPASPPPPASPSSHPSRPPTRSFHHMPSMAPRGPSAPPFSGGAGGSVNREPSARSRPASFGARHIDSSSPGRPISNAERIARLRSSPPTRKPVGAPGGAPSKPAYSHAFAAHHSTVNTMALSPEGRFLASASDDATIRLWETHSWFPLHTIEATQHPILDLCWNQSGEQLTFLDQSGHAEVWDVLSLASQNRFDIGVPPSCLAWEPKGRYLCLGCEDGNIQVWDLYRGQRVHTLSMHQSCVSDLQVSEPNRVLVSCDFDGVIQVWDLRNFTPLFQLQEAGTRLSTMSLCPRTALLITGSHSGEICLWDLRKRLCVRRWTPHCGIITDLRFEPEGRWFASCSEDQTIALWHTDKDEPLHQYTDPMTTLTCILPSHHGQWLASAGHDAMIKIWDTQLWSA